MPLLLEPGQGPRSPGSDWLPSPRVLGQSSTITSGDPGPSWETHPAIRSCLGTLYFWDGCLDSELQPASAPGQSSMEYRDTWGQFHLMLLTHTGTSIWVDISWHHCGHIYIRAHGCWDAGTGSGSAWAELDAVPGSSQERAGRGVGPAPTLLWVLRVLSGLWGQKCRYPQGQHSDMLQLCQGPAPCETARTQEAQAGHGVHRQNPAVGPWYTQHTGQASFLQPGEWAGGEADRSHAMGWG